MMEESSDCVGENLAPFNPSGDDVIRLAIEMLQVIQIVGHDKARLSTFGSPAGQAAAALPHSNFALASALS